MKAITLWQPYADAILFGKKRIETRSWSTKHRGPIAIHAAKKWCYDLGLLAKSLGLEAYEKHPRLGCVIATATLLDCVPTQELTRDPLGDEELFGDFTHGRYGWLLTDVQPLPAPIFVNGKQGLWEIDL